MQGARDGPVTFYRQTPFRLALTFAVLLILAFQLTGFAVFQQMKTSLNADLDEAVRSTFAILADTYQDYDIQDLVTAVDSYAAKASSSERRFSLASADGRQLAGTKLPSTGASGLTTLDLTTPGGETKEFRALSGDVGGNRLTVAFSTLEIRELLDVVLTVFGWASFAVVALAIAGGIWLAKRVQRRLDAIADTMNAISHGQLDARIPLIGSNDDIDLLSSRVNAALDRLSTMVDGVRQVSNDIAHELKTPLNRLQLMVESAIRKPRNNRRELHDALEEIGRLDATFEAMLRIARIESGAGKSRFAAIDLAQLLNDLVEIFADVAADEGRRLSFAGPPSGIQIEGDRDLVTQLFVNLIENALRHAPPSSAIHVSLVREQSRIVGTVADDGPGIPAAERTNVLRRLYRLDKSRSTPGSGLGLSIVAAIAELHGVDLVLDDNAPGLRVTVVFDAGGQPKSSRS